MINKEISRALKTIKKVVNFNKRINMKVNLIYINNTTITSIETIDKENIKFNLKRQKDNKDYLVIIYDDKNIKLKIDKNLFETKDLTSYIRKLNNSNSIEIVIEKDTIKDIKLYMEEEL